MELFLNRHIGIIQLVGGIIATAVTLTAFAYSTFQTKQDTQQTLNTLEQNHQGDLTTIEKRLDRIENKLDNLLLKQSQ